MKDITLFEVSYEVSNKVGGIYTVLVSKASYALERIKDYYTVGPYYEDKAKAEFRPENVPAPLKRVFSKLHSKHGIECHYGRWLIDKSPRAILVDPASIKRKVDDIKYELWEHYKIDSLHSDEWFNEPVAWSWAVGILIRELVGSGAFKNKVVAHFHEWLSCAGLLYLKRKKAGVATVFTTHSTVLGRTIAETGKEDLYEIIDKGLHQGAVVDDKKAYHYKVQAKHMMEKAGAVNADVFTTVSEIMARECRFMLGRQPEVLTMNGLDMNKFPRADVLRKMHESCRERIKNFLLGYFLPYYDVEADGSLVCFISGRYELRNKGIDVFIDALGRLNERLRDSGSGRNVFAFIWVPAGTDGKKPTVVEHLQLFEDVGKAIEDETGRIEKEVLKSFIRGEEPRKSDVFDSSFLQRLREMGARLKKRSGENPPITPFEMHENSITHALAKNGLLNGEGDMVKVIYYPAYLSEKDELLELKYYNAMAGCDVGVFPSYYESWGYTPLEAAALGLLSVTTDLSGFGKFIRSKIGKGPASIVVLERDKRRYDDVVSQLGDVLFSICGMSENDRLAGAARAKELSAAADWSFMYENYLLAYDKATGRH
ncbi:MAG: glycogen/starch synthase [Candidatus Aenigmarchaeota archaeon]|nr:glycogen/starch synthase [Candidatus Aenigmarchaeota archaeon]